MSDVAIGLVDPLLFDPNSPEGKAALQAWRKPIRAEDQPVTADEKPQRRRGRKPMDPELRKLNSMSFRMRGDLRAKLMAAAEISGRSLSEEIELRCYLSFARPEPFSEFVAAFARFVEAERAVAEPDDGLAEVAEAVIAAVVEDRIRAGGGRS